MLDVAMQRTKGKMRIRVIRTLLWISGLLGLAHPAEAGQPVTNAALCIDFADEPLYQALKTVERHFRNTVLFVYDEVQPYRVTAHLEARTAEEAVTTLLHDKPFFFKSGRDFISISRYGNAPSEVCVVGRVVDAANDPLPYAGIEIYDEAKARRTTAAMADKDGHFSIGTSALSSFTLKVSYVGYQPYTVHLENVVCDVQLGHVQLRDTVMALNSLSVLGESVLHKSDRILIFPTQEQREGTQSSADLLARLVLPGGNLLSAGTQTDGRRMTQMDIRINGRKASLYELRALRSEDVVYVEYLYGTGDSGVHGVSAINLVTKKETDLAAGVELAAGLPWAANRVAVYGRKTAETYAWNLAYTFRQHRQNGGRYDEESVSRAVPGQAPVYRQALTTRGRRSGERHELEAGGRWSVGENNEWLWQARAWWTHAPGSSVNRQLLCADEPLAGTDGIRRSGQGGEPSLELAYVRRLRDDAHLRLCVDGQARFGKEHYRYEASLPGASHFACAYRLEERLWSGKAEVGYEKVWGAHTLRFQGSHRQRFASLDNTGAEMERALLRTAVLRFSLDYAWKGRRWQTGCKGNLYRMYVGTGMRGRTFDWLAPEGHVHYRPGKHIFLYYTLGAVPVLPEVRQTAAFGLPADAWHTFMGRADLRPAVEWNQAVGMEAEKGAFSLCMAMNHRTVRHPLASVTLPASDGTGWCYRMENGTASTDWFPSVSLAGRLGESGLQWAVRYAWHRLDYRSATCRSRLGYSRWEAELSGQTGTWDYGIRWGNGERLLLGDAEYRLPDTNKLYVNWRVKRLRLGIDWQHPFCCEGEERQELRSGGGEQLRITDSKRALRNQINLTLSWTLGRGAEHK